MNYQLCYNGCCITFLHHIEYIQEFVVIFHFQIQLNSSKRIPRIVPKFGQSLSKARAYGSIGEEPIETHRMDTPSKETSGAAKKSQNRIGANSIKILQRNYRNSKQSTRGRNKSMVNQVEQMLKSSKSAPAKGDRDFHTHKRKGKGEGNAAKRARASRDANEYMRTQGAQRGINIADMLG